MDIDESKYLEDKMIGERSILLEDIKRLKLEKVGPFSPNLLVYPLSHNLFLFKLKEERYIMESMQKDGKLTGYKIVHCYNLKVVSE